MLEGVENAELVSPAEPDKLVFTMRMSPDRIKEAPNDTVPCTLRRSDATIAINAAYNKVSRHQTYKKLPADQFPHRRDIVIRILGVQGMDRKGRLPETWEQQF